jgi:antirestriction protein
MGCLAAYNGGRLHGEWIDLSEGVDAFDEACARILRTSPVPMAEELHGFDVEMMGSGEVGPGVCREVAELFDGGMDADEWARRMVAHDCDPHATVAEHYPDVHVSGPFSCVTDAEEQCDYMIDDVFHEAIKAIEGIHYASFDYESARRDLYDIVQAMGGAWWVKDTN